MQRIEELTEKLTFYNRNKSHLKTFVQYVKQYEENFLVQYTYETTAMEGNTLTIQETEALILQNITPSGKDLREIYEQINHKDALQYIVSRIKAGNELSEDIICTIHRILLSNIIPGGIYRNIPVYIAGAEWEFPYPEQLHSVLKEFYDTLEQKQQICEMPESGVLGIDLACWTHAEFVKIHPFVDGNGRTSRLMMNYQLINYYYVPISIPLEMKLSYGKALDLYACTGNIEPFKEIVIDLEIKALDKLISMEKGIIQSLGGK